MSKIGLGNNINQPTKQCFSCKYWKAATKLSLLEITEPGYCSAGFCKKIQSQRIKSLSWCLGIDIGNITGVYWESIDIKNGDYGIDSSNITIVY